MTNRDKIELAWQRAPRWDFTKNGPLHMPEPHETSTTPPDPAADPQGTLDHVTFEQEWRGGVRSCVRIVGRLRDTKHVVTFTRQ